MSDYEDDIKRRLEVLKRALACVDDDSALSLLESSIDTDTFDDSDDDNDPASTDVEVEATTTTIKKRNMFGSRTEEVRREIRRSKSRSKVSLSRIYRLLALVAALISAGTGAYVAYLARSAAKANEPTEMIQ